MSAIRLMLGGAAMARAAPPEVFLEHAICRDRISSTITVGCPTGSDMKLEGGCYCGQVRYAAEGEPMLKAQCHCRECQYISGGAPNMFMLLPPAGFSYVRGEPKQFVRSDLENAVTREFCAECGTHLTTRRPGLRAVILKVGTLDDPSVFGSAQMAIFTVDKQPFHQIAEGVAIFERLPPRA
jgi:hypothetical protein